MNTHPQKHIYPQTLLRIYKTMKLDPLKTFCIKDFGISLQTRNALNLLISLGLIKQVPMLYTYGPNYSSRKEVKGYRLINLKEVKPKQ